MKTLILCFLTFALANCMSRSRDQIILSKNNPMPNEVVQVGPIPNPSRQIITSVRAGEFRDASIHVGRERSTVMNQAGQDVFSIVSLSALPHKDMLNTDVSKWDFKKYRFVDVKGETAGCQLGIMIPIPGNKSGSRPIMPIHFRFAQNSFYKDISHTMELHKIQAMFQSRLDSEIESYLFGIFRRHCYRFHAIGIVPRLAKEE